MSKKVFIGVGAIVGVIALCICAWAWNVNDYMPRGPWIINENSEKVSGYNLDGSTKSTEVLSSDMEAGGITAVGIVAVEVTFAGSTKTIMITADSANTDMVYVGESNVTTAGANAMAVLDASDIFTIDYDDSSNALYVVGGAASQNFWKGALLQ